MRYCSKNKRDTPSEKCPECLKPIRIGQSAIAADNTSYPLDCAFIEHKTNNTNRGVRRILNGLEILLIMTAILILLLLLMLNFETQEYNSNISIIAYSPKEPIIKLKDLTNTIILVRVITYPSYKRLRAANFKKDKIPFKGKLLGWYIMRGNICEIHVLEPKLVRSIRPSETWGHELMHCTYGNYHK